MTEGAAPLPRPPAAARCPRCAQAFACGAFDAGPCACAGVDLPDARRDELRRVFEGCLCGDCLRAVAAGAPLQGPPR